MKGRSMRRGGHDRDHRPGPADSLYRDGPQFPETARALPDGAGTVPAPDAVIAPAAQPAAHIAAARITVCTGRDCRVCWDSPAFLADLKQAAAASGMAIAVASCGCVDLCAEAPVVIIGPADGATQATAAGQGAEQVFVNVEKKDIPSLIEAAKAGTQ